MLCFVALSNSFLPDVEIELVKKLFNMFILGIAALIKDSIRMLNTTSVTVMVCYFVFISIIRSYRIILHNVWEHYSTEWCNLVSDDSTYLGYLRAIAFS